MITVTALSAACHGRAGGKDRIFEAEDRPVELFGEFELLQLTDQFFAKAVYCAALGYEQVGAETVRKTSAVA